MARLFSIFLALVLQGTMAAAGSMPPFIEILRTTKTPPGWVRFCVENPLECQAKPSMMHDVVLEVHNWDELVRINRWVNKNIKYMTDKKHWGLADKWSYPYDGYGDCEDYVLLKRYILMQTGWSSDALLITLVRMRDDSYHAVLTVKTNKGDFILDNESKKILLWSQTPYRFHKRQSQSDPNVWVELKDKRKAKVRVRRKPLARRFKETGAPKF